jgi:rubrerythrin
MSRLVRRVRSWLADDGVVYECRNCGTTLDADADECPACDGDKVVCYEID